MSNKGLCNLNKPIYEIMQSIADEYGLDVLDLKSKCREQQLVWPRHLAMYMCYQAGYSQKFIGRAFNRSTSMSSFAVSTVVKLCSVYPSLNKERLRVLKELGILE